MSKFEWRKHAKDLYLPTKQPSKVDVPEMKFFTIEGRGNPNSEPFKEHIEILYGMSYAIRMMPKKGIIPEGYYEYTVFPLEGHWDLDEEGRKLDYLHKDHLVYKIMIRQPDFVTDEWYRYAINMVKQKNAHPDVENVRLENITEGLCVQAMHLGSYDEEAATFQMMEDFCALNQLDRADKTHKEIYISDPRKTAPEKLKTVLRFKVNEV
jgi:hypothetical protein